MAERKTAEASIVYKHGGWSVSVGDSVIGRSSSLGLATELLYQNGYKVHTYRRSMTDAGKVKFTATVLCFNPKEIV